jgi:chromosome partitioning protein
MTFAIASQKGGTGKTSTTISLASGLARKGKKVLLLDVDSQANSSKVLLPNYVDIGQEETIYETIINCNSLPIRPTTVSNLDIVPSHILLADTDVELTTALDHREARLKNELDKVKDRYEFVFIDCPPALSWLTVNAFTASESIIIVVSPGYFELNSLMQINKTLQKIQRFFNPDLKLRGYLFTMSDPTKNSAISLQVLRQTYMDKVFNTIIPRNTDLRDAHMNQKDIFAYAPTSNAAQAYNRLIDELFYR